MNLCETIKIIPKEEIERVFRESETAGAEMDIEFLCMEESYMDIAKIADKDTTIIDFGCAYAPQAFWFKDCKEYIGIDLPFGNNVRFQTDNTKFYLMTGQEFIKDILPSLPIDKTKTIAICSYCPDTELQEMVAKEFPNHRVVYCNEVTERFPNYEDIHYKSHNVELFDDFEIERE